MKLLLILTLLFHSVNALADAGPGEGLEIKYYAGSWWRYNPYCIGTNLVNWHTVSDLSNTCKSGAAAKACFTGTEKNADSVEIAQVYSIYTEDDAKKIMLNGISVWEHEEWHFRGCYVHPD